MEESSFDIRRELGKLPDLPGVYLMHDSADTVIYVGKAVNLKSRVRQYFQSGKRVGPKIEKMIEQISRFEYIVTDSEIEALVLECNLIKEYRPKYNTMLKDDKTYPYIKVTLGEAYPRLIFSRKIKRDRAKYYGPYTSAGAAKDTIELLTRTYRLRSCSRRLPADTGKERPCLNYHIKQCDAPCRGLESPEGYAERVREAMEFLGGKSEKLLASLNAKMREASAELDFERAARYRDLYQAAAQTAQRQKITNPNGTDRDILGLAMDDDDAVAEMFFVREGALIGREHCHIARGSEETPGEVLAAFIRQYYSGTPFVPKEIMLQGTIPDAEMIEKWLSAKRGSRVKIFAPQKGAKEKLVSMAAANAAEVLRGEREREKRERDRAGRALSEISMWLGIDPPERIEAYDISNTSGFESVASMVVYEGGRRKKSDYRRYRLRSVEGPDDYASMREVILRRFGTTAGTEGACGAGRAERLPDLILTDGGRGQVSAARTVLKRLELDIAVCGMVKDERHRSRALYFDGSDIEMDRHSEGFFLISHIQEEAHRFAIEYHKRLRSRAQTHSILDDIPQIGEKRRMALMKRFSSIEEIKAASVEELCKVPSMNRSSAESLYRYFRK